MLREQAADQLDQPALVGDGGVAARQLLHHERVGERIGAGAAVGVGHGDAEQAELGHPGVDVGREALGLVELARDRSDHVVGKAPRLRPDLEVRLGQLHGGSVARRGARSNCLLIRFRV